MLSNVVRLGSKAPNGVSKYMPHQGKREKLRRRLGGFHRARRMQAELLKYQPLGTIE